LWSKPGADFLCIEPWYGYASPVNFDGPFATKPGLLLIPPGGEECLTLRIRVSAA
jgi:galactose mutarotase-like enzyme